MPRVPHVKVSRRAGFAVLIILVLIIIAGVGATHAPTTTTQYVTNTLYLTTTQSQPVTLTELQTITVTQVTATGAQTQLVEYCFSPKGNCANILVKWINQASKSVHVLIYSFTLDKVRDALIQAKNRGVDVKVVMDAQQSGLQGAEYINLKNAGVPIRLDRASGEMHHKVAIIDGAVVITGSFNWSANANDENRENLVVLRDQNWAQAFEQQFTVIWNQATP
jgi:phosphatidylserine/phosphatidylglycerophosphate/cardiolipin synthase-like enzyme